MTTMLTIHQPQYLPYNGTVAKVLSSDIYISYDTADYQKNYYDNRNRIMTKNGQVWLTIPVQAKLGQQIKDVCVSSDIWRKKHLKTIRQYYSGAQFFDLFFPLYEKSLSIKSSWLIDYTDASWEMIFAFLGTRPKVINASELLDNHELNATEKLVQLTVSGGGKAYLSGPSWIEYMSDLSPFQNAGLEFFDCSFEFAEYPSYTRYAPYMSVIDLFLSVGPEKSLQYLLDSITIKRIIPNHDCQANF